MILKEFFLKLGLDVDSATFAEGFSAVAALELGLEKTAEAVAEGIRSFVEFVEKTAESAKELSEASQATGVTTKALQELRFAARESGVDAESLNASIFKLAKNMYAASKGGEKQAEAFSKLHVKVKGSNGQMRDVDETLGELADQFKSMPDGVQKTALAMEVFGRSGAKLIPLLNRGREGLEELRSEAFVMSDEQIAAGKELAMTQERVAMVTTNLWRSAIAPLLPAISELLKRYLAWRKENAAVMSQRIQTVLGFVIKAVSALGNAFVFITKAIKGFTSFISKNWKGVVAIISTGVAIAIGMMVAWAAANTVVVTTLTWIALTSVMAALATAKAWLLAVAPFAAIAAAVGVLLLVFDDLQTYAEGGDSLFGDFMKSLDEWLKPREDEPWFVTALKSFIDVIKEAIEYLNSFDSDTKEVLKGFAKIVTGDIGGLGDVFGNKSGKAVGAGIGDVTGVFSNPLGTAYKGLKSLLSSDNDLIAQNPIMSTPVGGMSLPRPAASMPHSVPTYQSPSAPNTQKSSAGNNVTINVTQMPGESGEALASRVKEQLYSEYEEANASGAAAR